jgi:hypothetical protein
MLNLFLNCLSLLSVDGEDMDMSTEEANYTMAIAKDMAKAVVQIARGIEPKYMQPPLG